MPLWLPRRPLNTLSRPSDELPPRIYRCHFHHPKKNSTDPVRRKFSKPFTLLWREGKQATVLFLKMECRTNSNYRSGRCEPCCPRGHQLGPKVFCTGLPNPHNLEKYSRNEIEVSGTFRDNQVIIEVKDRGEGVLPEHLPRVATPPPGKAFKGPLRTSPPTRQRSSIVL